MTLVQDVFRAGEATTHEFVGAFMDYLSESTDLSWLVDGSHHPEDIASNVIPTLAAFAAGWSEGVRRVASSFSLPD